MRGSVISNPDAETHLNPNAKTHEKYGRPLQRSVPLEVMGLLWLGFLLLVTTPIRKKGGCGNCDFDPVRVRTQRVLTGFAWVQTVSVCVPT